MSKKKQKHEIRVYFKDGREDVIPQKFWDDFEYVDHLFAVMRKGAWVAVYNMDVVACVVIH